MEKRRREKTSLFSLLHSQLSLRAALSLSQDFFLFSLFSRISPYRSMQSALASTRGAAAAASRPLGAKQQQMRAAVVTRANVSWLFLRRPLFVA